ncbi:MAG: hypothetical protein GQ570_15480 [Helicobacteraceae bacterium]|nr:hypothetical protein [Helicobacteraceae bacterium]
MNNITKTYVISDAHGCYHTLLKLLEQLPQGSDLIFVGDLCDRGLYSKEVIEFVMSNNYRCIKGNHDHYMIENIEECIKGSQVRWNREEYMGGKQTIDSYKDDHESVQKHLHWLRSLPNYLLIDNYFITHAFCLPYFKRRDDKDKTHAMMVNRVADEDEWKWDWEDGYKEYYVINIFGHDHSDSVQVAKNYFGIDTGCVYGGKLTAIELGSMKLFEQSLVQKDISDNI